MLRKDSKLVFSTDGNVPRKGRPVKKDVHQDLPPAQQTVNVRLDRKGRGGKTVTVIEGMQMPRKDMKSLLRQLKAKLGTGGAVKDTLIEIQGQHCDVIMAALKKMGYRPKRSGR